MKKIFLATAATVLAFSLCACSFGNRTAEPETTVEPTTQEPTSMPTLPPVKPNVPEPTEGRGSTDDTIDSPNETLPDDGDGMRRRIMN